MFVHSERMLEIQFDGGVPIRVGNQTGSGRKADAKGVRTGDYEIRKKIFLKKNEFSYSPNLIFSCEVLLCILRPRVFRAGCVGADRVFERGRLSNPMRELSWRNHDRRQPPAS